MIGESSNQITRKEPSDLYFSHRPQPLVNQRDFVCELYGNLARVSCSSVNLGAFMSEGRAMTAMKHEGSSV